MPLDPMIARGTQPVDVTNTLYQVARMGMADREEQRRNRTNDLLEQRFAATQAKDDEVEKTKHLLAKTEWALQSENPKAAILADPNIDPRAVEVFSGMPDEQVVEHLRQQRAQYASQLGIGPPPIEDTTPKLGNVNPNDYTPESLALFQQSGNLADLRRVPPQYAPQQPRQPTDYELYQRDPDGYAKFRQASRGGGGTGGGVEIGPNGELIVSPDPAKATEGERTSANYLGRMEASESLLGDYVPPVKDYAAARIVMQGGPVMASAANTVLSEQGQQYYQAAADWVRAKLRKESGAVIAPQEMEQEIKTYFPVPGDSPKTVAQKRAARAQAMSGMRQMGGRAVTAPASGVARAPERTPAPAATAAPPRIRFDADGNPIR